MKVAKKEFDLIREQIYRLCGLTIPDGKEYLVEHRFAPLFTERGCKSWMDFYTLMISSDIAFKDEVVSSISTHETSFFRDNHPFTCIRQKVLPKLVTDKKKHRKVRIWCAASSTGQEPYSLAMLIHEFCNTHAQRQIRPTDFSILATDISGKVLDKASQGIFSKLEVSRGLPGNYTKFFRQENRQWLLDDTVRSMVSFKKFNLLNSFKQLGQFDFVMCRNVLIYFDDETKLDIVHRIHSLLPDDGYLMLGSTETLAGQTDRYIGEHSGAVILYKKERGGRKIRSALSPTDLKYKKTFSAS